MTETVHFINKVLVTIGVTAFVAIECFAPELIPMIAPIIVAINLLWIWG